ncbi:hemophore-related protein [Mycobacterium hubeiense]|uniref:hemophore-related protein n=1 Tax=Mycobacterium hubeiense TaxID=1867256 RepID=UPI000C7E8788|nr:hemophore-related protein [Mycobacterium sp. QGD 101]
MTMSAGLGGVFAAGVLGGVAAATIALPPASAAPPCSAAAFATTASGVLSAAGQYLETHPGANDVLTAAGTRGQGAEQSVRDYFVAHPQEYAELRAIAQPLIDQQRGCNVAVSPTQIAVLYEAMANTPAA